jgi:hypothetical protein
MYLTIQHMMKQRVAASDIRSRNRAGQVSALSANITGTYCGFRAIIGVCFHHN